MNIPADRAQALKDDLYDPNGYAGSYYAQTPKPKCQCPPDADVIFCMVDCDRGGNA